MSASGSKDLKFPKGLIGKNVVSKDEFKAIYHNEAALQRQAEAYLDHMQLAYIRIPDAVYKSVFAYTNIPLYIKKLISSFIKGLPDLTVLYDNGAYQCIELKTKSGKLSQGQKTFAKRVGDNYYVVRSFEAFQQLIKEGLQC